MRAKGLDWYIKKDVDGHWYWRGATIQGYGYYTHNKKKVRVHRLIYELHYGVTIPARAVIDHKCRIRHCVNPEHLEIVTVAVNTQRGLTAKLSKEVANQIYDLYKHGIFKQHELGTLYGVTQPTIFDVVHKNSWV
jgi:hypothetical protein